jgi:hypothetical protein
MYEIMELSGQEYVDIYSTKAKADAEKKDNDTTEATA